jgi:hypothetical protein
MFGMVPHWADTRLARQTYNARTETGRKPSFRNARQRNQFCIIPAANFSASYETQAGALVHLGRRRPAAGDRRHLDWKAAGGRCRCCRFRCSPLTPTATR